MHRTPHIGGDVSGRTDKGATLDETSRTPALQLPEINARRSRTPFLEHEDAWVKSLAAMKPRQVFQYRSDIARFAATHACLQDVVSKAVRDWAEKRLESGDSLKTLQRRVSALRNYWGWLKHRGLVDTATDPWVNITAQGRKNAPTRLKRQAFTLQEVASLYRAAKAKGDDSLAALILLAVHTGARIEELCSAEVEQVVIGKSTNGDTEGPPQALRVSSKTEAGRRSVPLVGAAVALVGALTMRAQSGRWLIHSDADNQYGERSVSLGKRFSRLKTAEGHGVTLVFHSIRKTVATALQDAGCPEHIAANILGHEFATMTYGLYSAGVSQETRREWLEKALEPLEALLRPLVEAQGQEVQAKPRKRKPTAGRGNLSRRDRVDGTRDEEARRATSRRKG